MAAFLDSVAAAIVPCLCDCLTRWYHHLRHLPQNVESLRSEMDELNSIKSDLERRIKEDERRDLKDSLPQASHWLQRTDALEAQVRGIEENFNQRKGRCLNGCFPNCRSYYKLGKEAERLKNEVVEHRGKGSFDVVSMVPLPDPGQVFDDVNVVGDESTLDDIRYCIRKEDANIIGIYGMGGVGKTTLLKKINNEFLQQSQAFDVVILAVVSQSVNVKNIQMKISKILGLSFSEDEDQETRANKLLTSLRRRKFLLLLDDLWEPLNLQEIGVPTTTGKKESRIVLTTRSLDVCGEMGAQDKIEVKPLPEDEAWVLFRNNVGHEVVNSTSIYPLAKAVSKKCDGLPLALVTVARAMANRTTPGEWEDASTVLNKSALEFKGMKDKVFYLLKFSYDKLESETLKACFLYCSLFPEDRDIDREELIEYWIVEGLIGPVDSLDEAYNRGYTLIGRLIASCMLERGYGESDVKMHDIIRAMAIWVASESRKWLVRSGMELTRAPEEASTWGEAERISLMRNNIKEILPPPLECPKLSTLLLQENYNLRVIGERFFEHMPSLRVLDLRQTDISKLPPSLSLLKNLRALFISEGLEEQLLECFLGELKQLQVLSLVSCQITTLPNNLCELTNLFKLELFDNAITELPEGIGKLTKLRQLGLAFTSIERLPKGIGELANLQFLDLSNMMSMDLLLIPIGVISRLSRLKTLKIINTHVKWIVEGQIEDESDKRLMVDELECLTNLTCLTINIFDNHTLHLFLQSALLLKCTTELKILDCNDGFTQMLQSALGKLMNLDDLNIKRCNQLETVIIGEELQESSLPRLGFLNLDDLPNLVSIVKGVLRSGCLESLSQIYINSCKRLRNIEGLQQLQNLEGLHIYGGRDDEAEIEVMIGNEAVLENAFPRLINLRIFSLPRLRSICNQVLRLPSLQELNVGGCPELKRLPLDSHHAKSIRLIEGKREWWEGLEWEDDNAKDALQQLFVEDE